MPREELKLLCVDLGVPDTRSRAMLFIGACKGLYDIIVTPRRPTRTGKQNAFMHGVLFTMLADEMRSLGTEEADLDYAKAYLKDRFLREPVIDPSSGELIGYRTRETHKLNIDEGSKFIEQCIEHMTNDWHMTIPDPGEIIERKAAVSA